MTTVDTGAVVIGRNLGDRLTRALESLAGQVEAVVYVDSGSTDGSVRRAQSCGVVVHELSAATPFTAARARNEGLERLLGSWPEVRYVQFVDGDCALAPGWIAAGRDALERDPRLAVVGGRVWERNARATLFKRLLDVEWDRPEGEAAFCIGTSLARVAALREVGAYCSSLIAGEEPELGVRLRSRGWTIWRLSSDMAEHDADLVRFGQWWRRSQRSGYAFAQGAWLHGAGPERHWVPEARRIWVWGLLVPLAALGAAPPTFGVSLALLLGYPWAALRATRVALRRERSPGDAISWGVFSVLARFPELLGTLGYHRDRLQGRARGLIEYEGASVRAG